MRASLFLTVALAVVIISCDRAPPTEKPADPAKPVAAKPAPAPAPPVESPDEIQLAALTGVWRVVSVEPGPAAKFAKDDARIVGALMDVFPEQLSWSYKPSPAFSGSDVCVGPVSGVIEEGEFASRTRKLLAPAIARVKERLRHSRPHQWLCGDGGSWGDDAEFTALGDGRMAMRWPGDLTLILERIKRPPSNPPPLPPTGAYEDR